MMRSARRVATVLVVWAATSGVAAAQTSPASQARAPFPQDAKIAFVNLQYVFSMSSEGKAAATELQALQSRKNADITAKTKEVQALEQKLSQGAAVLNDEARGRLERDVARAKVDFERLVQDSEAEVQEKQQQFQRAFSRKLFPAIGEVAKEKNLWAVFSLAEASPLWHQPALDISEEIVGRIDKAR
jgi:Skp family chaperone for outer membrane proteins